MGTIDGGDGFDSERPSGPSERSATGALLPSFWPRKLTEAVIREARDGKYWPPEPKAGEPPWDLWYERALEDGLDDDLASLGRSLMHEAHVRRRWPTEQRVEAGWLDDGEAMLELARVAPEHARARWRLLLDHDED